MISNVWVRKCISSIHISHYTWRQQYLFIDDSCRSWCDDVFPPGGSDRTFHRKNCIKFNRNTQSKTGRRVLSGNWISFCQISQYVTLTTIGFILKVTTGSHIFSGWLNILIVPTRRARSAHCSTLVTFSSALWTLFLLLWFCIFVTVSDTFLHPILTFLYYPVPTNGVQAAFFLDQRTLS